ncbi:MAG: hypothetical protein AB7E29_09660 [Xanthobacter sp.]
MRTFPDSLRAFLIPALAFLALALPSASQAKSGPEGMIVCNQKYALCTSAPCIPTPGDPTQAICSCQVEEGLSLGTQACETLAPSTDANGIRTVYSTFSFVQFAAGKKTMTCPGGTPWTLCLNKVCTVDPSDPTKAICACEVKNTSADFVTLGGACDTNACNKTYWSAASTELLNTAGAYLAKAMKLETSPVTWCPKAAPGH